MKNKGFTLVELSIALVIVGLLIGGILVGQSLVESAKITSQVKQFQALDVATQSFVTKFKQLPGDCRFCYDEYTGDTHSRGNSNGYLSTNSSSRCNSSRYGECTFFFQDLVRQSFLPYTFYYGTTAPTTAIDPDLLIFQNGYRSGDYQTMLKARIHDKVPIQVTQAANLKDIFWTLHQSTGWTVETPSIPAKQAAMLEQKIDDGNPSTGSIVPVCGSWGGYGAAPNDYSLALQVSGNCNTNSCSQTSDRTKYDVSSSTAVCSLAVRADISK